MYYISLILHLKILFTLNVQFFFTFCFFQCRVFDQNEKYNIYLEETIWTRDCARRIKEVCDETDICEYIYNTINEKKYGQIFEMLCGDNFVMFEKFINGPKNNINPRVKIFIDTLRST